MKGSLERSDPGNDGLVVLPDGTKYVSSVRLGTVARIRPGQKAERIADGIPTAASMTYDSKRNRLVIPMNDWNAITIIAPIAPGNTLRPRNAASNTTGNR